MQKRSKKVYSTAERMKHDGFKISSFRDSQGLSQKEVAGELGMTQQNLSLLEQQPVIEDEPFAKVAKVLKIEPEALRRYEPKTGVYYNIQEMKDSACLQSNNQQAVNNVNPLEEYIKAKEENKQLYERLLAAEKEKVAILQELLSKQ